MARPSPWTGVGLQVCFTPEWPLEEPWEALALGYGCMLCGEIFLPSRLRS